MLKEFFGTTDDIEWHRTSCIIFNTWMHEKASIIDHVLYIFEQIDCLGKLGYPLHEQLRKDAISNSSPLSISTFSIIIDDEAIVNNHGMLRLLQIYEKDHQLHKELVNLVGGFSTGHHPFKIGKKKNKNKKQHTGMSRPNQIKKNKAHKSQAMCFYYK